MCELSKPNSPGTPTAPGIPDDRIGAADYQPDPGGIVRRGMLLITPGKPKQTPSVKHICNNPDPENQLSSLSFQMALGYLAEVQPQGKGTEKQAISKKATSLQTEEVEVENTDGNDPKQTGAKKATDPQTEEVEVEVENTDGNDPKQTGAKKATDPQTEEVEVENTDENDPKLPGIQPEMTPSGDIKLGDVILKRLKNKASGYRHLDNDGGYQILLNYRSNQNAVKVISLLDVLNDKVSEADIKDKVVLMGYTAAVVHDTFYTPFSAGAADNQKMPGVVVHAQNASQIISAVLDKQPLISYWHDGEENIWIFGWTVLGAILAWKIRTPWLLVLGVGVGITFLGGTAYYLFIQALWIPLVPPLLGLLLSATSVVLIDRYAATIVKTVKGFLKINVEIDQKKKEEEVAAIVESDYFLELQEKAKNLRGKEKTETGSPGIAPTTKENTQISIPPLVSNIEEALPLRPPTTTKIEETIIDTSPIIQPMTTRRTTEIVPTPTISYPQSQQLGEEVNYLQQVYDRRNRRNASVAETPASQIQSTPGESANEDQDNAAYLKQLQMRSKGLKEGRK